MNAHTSRKQWLIGGVAFVGLLILIQLYRFLDSSSVSYVMFIYYASYFMLGVILSGSAFSAFRNKEKTIHFIQVPTSNFEKYLFEVMRIVLPLALYPFAFWATFEFSGFIAPYLFRNPDVWHLLDKMHIWDPANVRDMDEIRIALPFFIWAVSAFATLFLGTTIFRNKPILKMLFIVAIYGGLLLGIAMFFLVGLDWSEYAYINQGGFFTVQNNYPPHFLSVLPLITLVLLFIAAYFNLKEKEA